MKRISLIVIFLTTIFPYASAQYESAVAHESTFLGSTSEGTLVRTMEDGVSISIHPVQHGIRIAKTDFAMQCATSGAPVSTPVNVTGELSLFRLIVNDMRIFDDRVYFCGSFFDTLQPQPRELAFIGDFYIQELDDTNLSVRIHVFDSMRTFRRMVVYKGLAGPRVVAVGSYRDQTTNPATNYYAFGVYDIASTPNSCIVFKDLYDFYSDVVLADTNVIIAGHDWNNQNRLFLYKMGMNTTSPSKTRYDPDPWEPNGNICATYLEDGYVAVAYTYYRHSDYNTFMRLRVMETQTMKNKYSQEFPSLEKYDPIEMVYDSEADLLTVMHPTPFNDPSLSTNYMYFVQMYPFLLASYTSNVLYPIKGKYYSFDSFLHQYYVSVGHDYWYFQHTVAPQPNPYDCPKVREIKISSIPNLDPTPLTAPPSFTTPVSDTLIMGPVMPSNINLICND